MSRYREQYERMKRMYDRFEEASERVPAELSGRSLTDDGLNFFQSCLHLRDWIENDEELPLPVREAARPYVKDSRVLSLCHDIAIGAKHLTVDRPLAPGENPRLNPVRTISIESRPLDDDDSLPPRGAFYTYGVRLVLETKGGDMIALAFASDCVEEWENFFKLHALT